MGGTLSVTFSNICMVQMGNKVVTALEPKLYWRIVEDIFNLPREYTEDILFKRRNNYHQNIKLTIEIGPTKFMDTIIIVSIIFQDNLTQKYNKIVHIFVI